MSQQARAERLAPRFMKTLAFLQNQWVRNPKRVQQLIEEQGEDYRRMFVSYALFAGCLTGRRIRAAFGTLVDDIAWDNVSPRIGGKSTDCFAPDTEHMWRQFKYHKPSIILAFGTQARDACRIFRPAVLVVEGPHPAARQEGVRDQLRRMALEYQECLKS